MVVQQIRPVLPAALRWHRVAHLVPDVELKKGYGPGTTLSFLDHVPGPYAVAYGPTQPEPRVDERQIHKDIDPPYDWDMVFDHRDQFIVNFENPPPPK